MMSNVHWNMSPIVIYAHFNAIHSYCSVINYLAFSTVRHNSICFIPTNFGSTCREKYSAVFMPQWCTLWECSTKSLLARKKTMPTESNEFLGQCFGTRVRSSALFLVVGTRNTFYSTVRFWCLQKYRNPSLHKHFRMTGHFYMFFPFSASMTSSNILPQNLSLLQYPAGFISYQGWIAWQQHSFPLDLFYTSIITSLSQPSCICNDLILLFQGDSISNLICITPYIQPPKNGGTDHSS